MFLAPFLLKLSENETWRLLRDTFSIKTNLLFCNHFMNHTEDTCQRNVINPNLIYSLMLNAAEFIFADTDATTTKLTTNPLTLSLQPRQTTLFEIFCQSALVFKVFRFGSNLPFKLDLYSSLCFTVKMHLSVKSNQTMVDLSICFLVNPFLMQANRQKIGVFCQRKPLLNLRHQCKLIIECICCFKRQPARLNTFSFLHFVLRNLHPNSKQALFQSLTLQAIYVFSSLFQLSPVK